MKKFRVGRDEAWYLMALHRNATGCGTPVARRPAFAPQRGLCTNLGDADAYIVAVGFVVTGEQEAAGRRVLGLLYGAGAAPSLDANRIFARGFRSASFSPAATNCSSRPRRSAPIGNSSSCPRGDGAAGAVRGGRHDAHRPQPATRSRRGARIAFTLE